MTGPADEPARAAAFVDRGRVVYLWPQPVLRLYLTPAEARAVAFELLELAKLAGIPDESEGRCRG